MNYRLLCLILTLIITLSYNAQACGCGIALENIEVFNQLKETQAYLLIDVRGPTEYVEMPYFRMVSMEEPQDVKIVFPIDQIPYDVQGKTVTARDFLNTYGMNSAEVLLKKQSISGVIGKVGSDLKQSSSPLFLLSNGLISILGFVRSNFADARSGNFAQGLVVRYEFEGGAMEIYDVKSMDTLDEFVKQLNMTTTGEVERLVEKYNDYYVAVLYLKVNSVLDNASLQKLKTQCPERFEEVKALLQEEDSFTQRDLYDLYEEGVCGETLYRVVNDVINADDTVNGTLVQMYFKDTDEFFYPTSIVNSYKYPVTDQKYFVKTPIDLHAKLTSSKVANIGISGDERWYKITSTEEDLKGKIVEASFGVRIGDIGRVIKQAFYNNSYLIVLIIYLAIVVLPFVWLKKDEKWDSKDYTLVIVISFFGGLLISSIVMFARKKRQFGFILGAIWLSFMALAIISSLLF